jgi:hypothetical protein
MVVAPTCDNMPKKALPYDVLKDFTSGVILNGANSSNAFQFVTNPNCDATTFPPFPVLAVDGGTDASDAGDASTEAGVDGGADGSADGSSDAPADTATLALVDDAGTDAAVDAAADAAVDSPVDAGGSDTVVADAGTDAPKDAGAGTCIEFSYDPDVCVAAGGAGCWDGVIFAPTQSIGATAPGICIAEGAKHITFEARASRATMVKFGGSGKGGDGTGTSEFFENLTTAWQTFTIDGPTNVPDYNTASPTAGVWDGFSVVGTPENGTGGVYILVRNVRWTQ